MDKVDVFQVYVVPLSLSFIAGLGTLCGSIVFLLFVRLGKKDASPLPPAVFAKLQAVAAGVMLLLSLKLFVEASDNIGFIESCLWIFVGAALMYFLQNLMLDSHSLDKHWSDYAKLDSGLPFTIHKDDKQTRSQQIETLRTAVTVYVAMLLHNLPEGLGVAFSATSSYRLGFQIASAICLHNAIEGLVISLPIYQLTGSVYRVLFLSLMNGLAEPCGVLLAWLFCWLFHMPISEMSSESSVISRILALISGVMSTLSITELIPHALHSLPDSGSIYTVVIWVIAGGIGGFIIVSTSDWLTQ